MFCSFVRINAELSYRYKPKLIYNNSLHKNRSPSAHFETRWGH